MHVPELEGLEGTEEMPPNVVELIVEAPRAQIPNHLSPP